MTRAGSLSHWRGWHFFTGGSIAVAAERSPRPIIAGVVERGELREFSEHILLQRVYRGTPLKRKGELLQRDVWPY